MTPTSRQEAIFGKIEKLLGHFGFFSLEIWGLKGNFSSFINPFESEKTKTQNWVECLDVKVAGRVETGK